MVIFLENILCLSAFLLAAILIVLIERKLWQTYVTPVTLSVVPLAAMLSLSVVLSSCGVLTEFYPKTTLFLLYSIILFELPSIMCNSFYKKRSKNHTTNPMRTYWLVFIVSIIFILIYGVFINRSLASVNANIGTDDFAAQTAAGGLFAHVRSLLIGMLTIWICLYEKKNRIFPIIFIFAIIAFTFINQVKGWIVMPVLAGLILRVILNKTKFNLPIVLTTVILGILVFYLSYYFALVIGNNNRMNTEINDFILNHIVHYLTSGIMGLNHYLHSNIIEPIDLKRLFIPFVNLFHALTGGELYDPEMMAGRSFVYTGVGMSNTRTLYGSAYIFIGAWFYPVYIMAVSFLMYIINIIALNKRNIFITAIFAWFCATIFMSWFDSYYQLFTTFEVPFILFIFYFIDKFR
ncbi:MAG: DUF6337 family protein [Rikenellaceae bacterium]